VLLSLYLSLKRFLVLFRRLARGGEEGAEADGENAGGDGEANPWAGVLKKKSGDSGKV
jgi:hypothetical protein